MSARSSSLASLVVASLLVMTATARAQPAASYASAARVAYIAEALRAVGESTPESLREAAAYARAMAHGACASLLPRLRIACLVAAGARYCKNDDDAAARRCTLALDVISSNLVAEEVLIPDDKRYQIMRAYKDYRQRLADELRRLQGTLAADFHAKMGAGSDDDARLARAIDAYCLASADDTNLAWQSCVSSLMWFIRGER